MPRCTIHRREAGHHQDVGQSGIMRLFHDIEPNIQPKRLKFADGIVDIYYFVEKSEEGPRCITARLIQGQMQRGTEENIQRLCRLNLAGITVPTWYLRPRYTMCAIAANISPWKG